MTTKKLRIICTTLIKKFINKTISNSKTNIESWQVFNFGQEKVLLSYTLRLVTYDIFFILMLVKIFAKEIYKDCFKKN